MDSVIRPGQKLLLPGVPAKRPRAPRPRSRTGTWSARRHPVRHRTGRARPAHHVMALNHLSAADVIFPGQRLLLPGPAPAAPATPTPLRAPRRA